jgi:hypothetical protein
VGQAGPVKVWQSGRGNWTWGNSKIAAADVRGSGRVELCVLYNYGGNDTGLWVFKVDQGAAPVPTKVWQSGRGNWTWENSKVIGADVRGTGTPEVCILYDYGANDTGLWVFPGGGTAPIKIWQSGRGNWAWSNTKLFVADIHGSGRLELGMLYNYGGNDTALWTFPAGAAAPVKVWESGRGNWTWENSKVGADND